MAQAVMLQGTASDAGKSMLAADLCRIFYQDGLRTAPFKSQNMALNSGITPDGKEMERAQIFQAEAAGITPDVRMNPVLLKPTSDHKAQVVLMGKVATNMDAVSYHDYRPRLRE
ncbi:cobyric acid synthase [Salmonella enterica subsp. houtenae]|nr:cobyric acid synthase [Salmonella enterica subsp. houtenae]EAN3151514.1 cobyric acid synthase [Salmonella enterica]EAO1936282.1 cobyric acid synthase [Salmonella enterica]EAQ3300875.1 cobyric acid synthase [Salmonella enterica]EAQ6167401.1 cobyric acid synthase [Salmonella enterica]